MFGNYITHSKNQGNMFILDDWLQIFIPKNSFYEFLQNTTVS